MFTINLDGRIRWQASGSILVPSRTDPACFYTIDVDYEGKLSCACIGFCWYDLCRHVESAAYILENYTPKTEQQSKFKDLTKNDPARVAFRGGAIVGSLPRTKRNWNDE